MGSFFVRHGILFVVCAFTQTVSAAPIDMPEGSKVWMKFEASVCPDADGDDCIASNLAGPNPPYGIPVSTFSSASLGTATGFAEILPIGIGLYSSGSFSNFLHASFEDSYTVVGSTTDPFIIPVEFHATGEGRSVPAGPFHQLIAFGEAEIGVFQTFTDGASSEGFRVQPFDAASLASFEIPFESRASPFSRPIDVTARHTVENVRVGDTFTLAYGMNWRSSKGEGDLRNGGAIAFELPTGVLLSSARAQSLLPDYLYLVGNVGVTDLSGVIVVAGDVVISDNSNLTAISMDELNAVAGSVSITNNEGATVIDLSGVETVNGPISMGNNQGTSVIDISGIQTVDGPISIANNQSASVIDLSGLQSVAGDITITDNGNATVSLGSLDGAGDVTLESTGSGTFSIGNGQATGTIDLTLDGYSTIATSTGGVATEITMINNEATMEVMLPNGAFTSEFPVAFSVTTLPGSVEIVDGQNVTHLARYEFDFAIPTLNAAAELNFQIDLAEMDEPNRVALLDFLHNDAVLTIGVLGDEPDAELQLFDVCPTGSDPVLDDCVSVLWFDGIGNPLDPTAGVDPAVLRFESLVGHFSTYSVVAISSSRTPGDIDEDGDVDRTDAALFAQHFGLAAGATWQTGDFDGDFATSLTDLAMLQAYLGHGEQIPSASAVPEPSTLPMLVIVLVSTLFHRAVRTRHRVTA